ncbi:MAG TPA: DUF3870 domain-containing protein [Nitrospiria bacterium]|nr:DUF3870 domain-containing protein [Nitrospiria bacterium]
MDPKAGTFIFGGQARLPKELSAVEVFQVVAHIDVPTAKVVEVDFMPCPPLIVGMLRQMMVGMSLQNDVNDLLVEIEQRLFHKSKKAVITAIKDLVREYREYQYRATKSVHPPAQT